MSKSNVTEVEEIRAAASAHQTRLLEVTVQPFSKATEESWKLLRWEVIRERTAICEVLARCKDRWAEMGQLGEVVQGILVKALMAEPRDWFEQACWFLDAARKPHVIVALDVETEVGEKNGPGPQSPIWRSTLSRGAAIELLRALATELEKRPELLEDAHEPS